MQYTVQKFVMSTYAHISRLSPDVPPIMHADPAELTILAKHRDTVRVLMITFALSRVSGRTLSTVCARTATVRDTYRMAYASRSAVRDDAAADLTSGALVVSCAVMSVWSNGRRYFSAYTSRYSRARLVRTLR